MVNFITPHKNMKYILSALCLIAAIHAAPCTAQVPSSPHTGATQAPEQDGTFFGKVVETMNAADYTYLLVNTGSKKLWVAAPKFQVKVGDSVSIVGGMAMPNYHSKTLNRDFDVVYFTGNVAVNGARPASSAGPSDAAALPKNHPPIGNGMTAPSVDLAGIKKAKGGKTVEEIITNKAALDGQSVTVRGRVVKYNHMILGRNWLHIRDGSGGQGNNDLLVTTTAEVKTGDTVLVTGKVALEKDFGSGYRYAVMIEDAKVVVE
jgi:hypothetical protein